MNLEDIKWALSEQSLVTPVEFGMSHVTVLVHRIGAVLTQQMPPVSPAFVLTDNSTEGLAINGVYVDLGESTQEFRNILDEASAVAILGQTYLSDPEAGRGGSTEH